MENVQIQCFCKDCRHSEPVTYGKESDGFYCYYWDFEQGMSPNEVDANDFCSNGERE